MVSILNGSNGEQYNYKFPLPFQRKYNLKDMLENEVDEKYYLSQRMIKYIVADNEKWTGNNSGAIINRTIGCTINTAPTQRRCDASNYVCEDLPNDTDLKKYVPIKNNTEKGYLLAEEGDGINICGRMEYQRGNVQKGMCQTINTKGTDNGVVVVDKNGKEFMIKDTKQLKETIENNELEHGTCLDLYNRTTDKEIAKTVDTGIHNDLRICVKDTIPLKRGYSVEIEREKENVEGIDNLGSYSKCDFNQTSVVGKNGIAPTVSENHGQVTAIVENKYIGTYNYAQSDTLRETEEARTHIGKEISGSLLASGNHNGVIEDKPVVIGGLGEKKSNKGKQWYEQDRIYSGNACGNGISAQDSFHPYYGSSSLRIRKLTPKECMRLMAFQDQDEQSMRNVGLSDSAIYHCAGDSICVNVLVSIFSKLFGADNMKTIEITKEYVETIKEQK